ncbi:hypothetical protein V8C43DRAFT_129911 [Trichoderma afarasin]
MLWMLAARAANSCIAISYPTDTASASRVPYLGSRINEYLGIGRLKRCPRLDGYSRVWSVLACDWCLGRLSPPKVFHYERNTFPDGLMANNMVNLTN